LVPVMYMVDDASRALFQGMLVERVSVPSRRLSFAELAQAADKLRRDSTNRRIFIRYAAQFPAEMRYGGRVFECLGTNLSRGGLMVMCGQIPPVGTEVGISMHLHEHIRSTVTGRVMRVDLVRVDDQDMAQVGIEFDTFVDHAETDVIQYLQILAQTDGSELAAPQDRIVQAR